MPEKFHVIEGEYLRDLLQQPQALADTCEGLAISRGLEAIVRRLSREKFQQIVLTGMGSSFHALHLLNLSLIAHGFRSLMVETSELIHYQTRLLGSTTLVVAVSQSGQSAEMMGLIKINRGSSPIIAVTNTEKSPLALRADAVVLTRAGSEFSVSCKTYVASAMALEWLGAVLCGVNPERCKRDLRGAAMATEAYLTVWRDHVQELAGAMAEVRHLFLVGRGPSLAAVGTGALIVKESAHFHAEGMSSAAFRHGPMEMLGENSLILVFSGDAKTRRLNQKLLTDIREQRGRAESIGEDAGLDSSRIAKSNPSVRAILEILPVQMLTLAIAARTGREAGKFDRVTKITSTE